MSLKYLCLTKEELQDVGIFSHVEFLTICIVFQVLSKEREIQRTREIKEDFSSRINGVSEKLKGISAKFKEKSPDVDHAKEEVKVGFQLICFFVVVII